MTSIEFMTLAGFLQPPLPRSGHQEARTITLKEVLGDALGDVKNADLGQPPPQRRVSFAAELGRWGGAYRRMPAVTDSFWQQTEAEDAAVAAEEGGRDPHGRPLENVRGFQLPYIWLTEAGGVTPCHYDMYRNFYVQLRGRKHFLLLPPSAHAGLYPYPALHPAHRSARVTVRPGEAPTQMEAQTYPLYSNLSAVETTLAPGEVLFIPAMWFHQVTAVDSSISVNMWSATHAIQAVAQAQEIGVSAFSRDYGSEAEKVQALRTMWRLVLPELVPLERPWEDEENEDATTIMAQRFVQRHVLDSRYMTPVSGQQHPEMPPAAEAAQAQEQARAEDVDSSGDESHGQSELRQQQQPAIVNGQFCHNEDAFQEFLRDPFATRELQRAGRDMVHRLQKVQRSVTGGRFPTLLANVVETVTNEAVGPTAVQKFLHDWIHC